MIASTLGGETSQVIIVDDQSAGRKILEQVIRSIGLEVEIAVFDDPVSALQRINAQTPDLILTDYMMPGMDGVIFTQHVRNIPACADVPLVVVTVVEDRQIRYEAFDAGATDFLNRPIDQYECRARCRNLLIMRHQQKLIQDRARLLENQVALATQEILARERETLLRLAKAGEYRDEGTGNHVLRIARYCRIMAETMGLPLAHCEDIELAAPMHDIGKVGIPDSILLKPARLTDAEFAVIRGHPRIGYEILKDSPSHFLQLGATIALSHHEKFDGTGYPRGQQGDDIPIEARIVAVADVFDALVSERPYKPSWSVRESIDYLRDLSGTHFDPRCVDTFIQRIDDIRYVGEDLQDAQRSRISLITEDIEVTDTLASQRR
ncbi:HD domain-containing phosphohydrolase [uncultured Thiocystis sp.]|uniref:response regulator n=1 Tax=uncultured Thiocystis sp. TaxID=1202134 RepID=UPI0025D7F8DE|nr:HD domain-containing phosphohydrolase [uncultured Thiocystis sp.]